MTRTKLFHSKRSQALRLPKDVAFPPGVRDVTIVRDGPRRVITPAGTSWDDFFDHPASDLGERVQPRYQGRDSF